MQLNLKGVSKENIVYPPSVFIHTQISKLAITYIPIKLSSIEYRSISLVENLINLVVVVGWKVYWMGGCSRVGGNERVFCLNCSLQQLFTFDRGNSSCTALPSGFWLALSEFILLEAIMIEINIRCVASLHLILAFSSTPHHTTFLTIVHGLMPSIILLHTSVCNIALSMV